MMKNEFVVHKYVIFQGDADTNPPHFTVEAPVNATLLKLCEQRNDVVAYFRQEAGKKDSISQHHFFFVETGEPFEDDSWCHKNYIDTITLDDGDYVLHVFHYRGQLR